VASGGIQTSLAIPFRPAARVTRPAGLESPASDPARCSTVVLNAGHASILAMAAAVLRYHIPASERERDVAQPRGGGCLLRTIPIRAYPLSDS
jgi:hypothetical protein